jgi:hypothetical protein
MKQTSITYNVVPGAASVAALVAGLAAIDSDIRAHVVGFFSGNAPSELSSVDWYVRDAARVVWHSVKDHSFGHGPLITFGVAAGVLLLFMLRT